MLSLIAVEHGYLKTQIYTTIDVNNNNYLYRDILCRCDMLVITALSPNSTYLAGMNRLIICDRLALLQSLISSTR